MISDRKKKNNNSYSVERSVSRCPPDVMHELILRSIEMGLIVVCKTRRYA